MVLEELRCAGIRIDRAQLLPSTICTGPTKCSLLPRRAGLLPVRELAGRSSKAASDDLRAPDAGVSILMSRRHCAATGAPRCTPEHVDRLPEVRKPVSAALPRRVISPNRLGMLRLAFPAALSRLQSALCRAARLSGRIFSLRGVPVCRRMDLNGWTGKTYTNPPAWVAFKVMLGARSGGANIAASTLPVFASARKSSLSNAGRDSCRRRKSLQSRSQQNPSRIAQARCNARSSLKNVRGAWELAAGNSAGRPQQKTSRVHGTIERTTGMLGVRSAAGCTLIPRLPLADRAFQRTPGQCHKRILNGLASSRSRKLGTAFRSPVTTLSPPLRGQCSRPAPSLPRRSFPRIRSIAALPLGSVSKPKPGEFNTLDPLSAGLPAAPVTSTDLHSPSGISTLRIKAFDRLHHRKPALPDVRLSFCSPLRSLSILASDQRSKLRLRPAPLSFRKPWN